MFLILFDKIFQCCYISIAFVDQKAHLRGRPELFFDALHMISEGNRLKARLFFEKTVELKLIES
jgi:predicted ester cyclase